MAKKNEYELPHLYKQLQTYMEIKLDIARLERGTYGSNPFSRQAVGQGQSVALHEAVIVDKKNQLAKLAIEIVDKMLS